MQAIAGRGQVAQEVILDVTEGLVEAHAVMILLHVGLKLPDQGIRVEEHIQKLGGTRVERVLVEGWVVFPLPFESDRAF